MVFTSRWETSVPDTHLATLLFQSPTHPLSKTKKCFVDVDQPDTIYLTSHEFRLWSQRVAAGLRKSGVKTGDRVLVFSGNSIAFPVLYMGILMVGAIFTSANPAYIARELGYQVKDSGAVIVFCAEATVETAVAGVKLAGLSTSQIFVFNTALFQQARGPGWENCRTDFRSVGCRYWGEVVAAEEEGSHFHWDDLPTPNLSSRTLALNYSSGTTGVPKGVEISHKNVVANILQFNHLAQLDPKYEEKVARSRWLCPLPMYHAMGQNMFIGIATTRGIPVYLLTKYDFGKFLRAIERFRITDLTLVPPVVIRMAKDPQTKLHDLSSVETIFCGAAPLGKEGSDEAEALWPGRRVNIKQGWGMTEYEVLPCRSILFTIPCPFANKNRCM
jgi:4-coumarate--CoA ligase